jgi:GT2 family glycosyltransferase/acetyltransferase-like isoleucine patch superfamily enzyme
MLDGEIMKTETIEIQKEFSKQGGKLSKYQELILGEKGLFRLLKYEFIIGLASQMPGALGLLLRSKLYPKLLGRVGRNATFGVGVVLRHPGKIFIGDNVIIDDCCVLDAKGKDNHGIRIGNGVFLGRNTILNCKNGDIILEDNVNISFNTTIFSASEVRVGADNLLAAYCYLVGGTHHFDDPSVPVMYQGRSSKGIQIGPGGWLGAHVTVFDGVKIGKHAVIGAGSLVNKDLPDNVVAAGAPAKVIRKRKEGKTPAKSLKRVTIAVINHNGEAVLPDTLDSILKLNYSAVEEILLVDDGSTDGSIRLVQNKYPSVKVFILPKNLGPSAARNRAIREAKADWILITDNDVILSPDVLIRLEAAVASHPQAGMAGVQVRLFGDPDKIQYSGAHIHYAGGAVQNKIVFGGPVVVGAVPGAALLIDRTKAQTIGLFDEDFYYGWEDGDFSFRMSLAGYPVLVVPEARVFHKKRGTKGLHWIDYQVRNRWWFLLKNYYGRTLIVCLPAILLYQMAMIVFFAYKGQLISFLKGTAKAFWGLPMVLRKRKQVMGFKTIRDRRLLTGAAIDLMGDVDTGGLVRIAMGLLHRLFSVYWMVAKYLVK